MNYFWIHCTLISECWNAASIHFRVLERIKHRFFNCMHPIHIPRTRKKAFRVQWIIFEFIAPSFQSAGTQPASISECWNASKTNFRVLETNLKVLKTNFKVLKIDFRVLEPNFKVPKLEKAKIRSVLFVSQVICMSSGYCESLWYLDCPTQPLRDASTGFLLHFRKSKISNSDPE